MRRRSKRWEKMAIRGRFTFDAKARINGKDYRAISAPRIVRNLMPAPLSVGNCNSATLHLSILTDDEIVDKTSVVILGRIANDEQASEWQEFGTFFIDQRDSSFEGLVTVDCFDAMLKTNQNYLSDNDTSASWPKSMKTVVEEVAYRIGVGIDPRTRIRTGADYMVPFPKNRTMNQVMGYIAACHGGNWIITEENLLYLAPLITAPDETFHIIDSDYNIIQTNDGHLLIYKEQEVFNAVLPAPAGVQPDSPYPRTFFIVDEAGNYIVTPEGYYLVWDTEERIAQAVPPENVINIPVVCGSIKTGSRYTVTGVMMTDESGNVYTAGNDTGKLLKIESNPYATQGICDDLYAAYNGLVYFPFTATKALYDPATELGDQVKIGDQVHSVIYSATLTLDHNFRADISAPNSEELSTEYPYLSNFQRLKQSAEELNAAIEQNAEDLAGKVSDTDLQAEIERASLAEQALSSAIGAEATRAHGAETSLAGDISTNAAAIRANASNITALQGDVSQNAQDIASLAASILAAQQVAQAISTLQGNVSTLQTTTGQHTTDISQLQSDIGTINTTLAGIQNDISAILNRLNALDGGGV